MKFDKISKYRSQGSMKFYKKLELHAQKTLQVKNQKRWLDWQFIMEAARLEFEEIPEEEMYKHFKVVYNEAEHNCKFLLDSSLKKLGMLVLRVKQTNGDLVYIYLQKGYHVSF